MQLLERELAEVKVAAHRDQATIHQLRRTATDRQIQVDAITDRFRILEATHQRSLARIAELEKLLLEETQAKLQAANRVRVLQAEIADQASAHRLQVRTAVREVREALEAQIDELQGRLRASEGRIAHLEAEKGRLTEENRRLQEEIAALRIQARYWRRKARQNQQQASAAQPQINLVQPPLALLRSLSPVVPLPRVREVEEQERDDERHMPFVPLPFRGNRGPSSQAPTPRPPRPKPPGPNGDHPPTLGAHLRSEPLRRPSLASAARAAFPLLRKL